MWHAFEVQKELWGNDTNLTCGKQIEITQCHKQTLDSIRTSTSNKINEIHDTSLTLLSSIGTSSWDGGDEEVLMRFSRDIETESITCSNKMLDLIAEIMDDCVEILTQDIPCPFAVVAIGSLARGEATPFSDLEYIFLIEESNEHTLRYFEKLAYTSYFLLGNLRETKLSYMDIRELKGWFDDRCTNGLKIDGLTPEAGNIPTGNGIRDKNIFITTPQQLIEQYNTVLNNPDMAKAKRGDLSAMLTYTKLIKSFQGGHELLKEFCRVKDAIIPNDRRTEVNLEMLKQDLSKFNFKPHEALCHNGFTLDVKKELYRFPSILLFDLAIIFNSHGETSWQTLDSLYSSGFISKEIHTSLKFILACACYIRLAAYLYHGSHDDRVSVARQMQVTPHEYSDRQQRRWFVPTQVFWNMCEHMLPLKQKLASDPGNIRELLLVPDVLVADDCLNIQHLYFVGEYKQSLNAMNKCYQIQVQSVPQLLIQQTEVLDPTNRFTKLKIAAEILFRCQEYDSALIIYKELAKHRVIHDWLHRAACHIHLSQYTDAAQVLSGIQADNGNRKSPGLSFALGNLSYKQGHFRAAERHYLIALQDYDHEASDDKLYDYYGSLIKTEVTDGSIGILRKDFIDMKPEEILETIFNASTGIINCLTSLGRVHSSVGDNKQAEKYFSKSLKLLSTLYGADALIPMRALVYQSMGRVQKKLNRHRNAMNWYKKAHSQFLSIHGTEASCEDIADLLFNMATNLSAEGIQPTAAHDTMQRALNIYQNIDPEHAQIVKCRRFINNFTCSIWLTTIPLSLLSLAALVIIMYVNSDFDFTF